MKLMTVKDAARLARRELEVLRANDCKFHKRTVIFSLDDLRLPVLGRGL
jgi:hypothetical protein